MNLLPLNITISKMNLLPRNITISEPLGLIPDIFGCIVYIYKEYATYVHN
jgi:hypothetical protein